MNSGAEPSDTDAAAAPQNSDLPHGRPRRSGEGLESILPHLRDQEERRQREDNPGPPRQEG